MYHIVVNPASKSGRGMKIWKQLLPILMEQKIKYDVYFTKGVGDAAEYIKKVEKTSKVFQNLPDDTLTNRPNQIIVLGGDGTINEVLQGITDTKHTRLAYIPTGSSNDLARALNTGKRSAEEQLLYILEHPDVTAMDIGCCHINGTARYFAVSCGIGFDAAVCEEALHSVMKDRLNHLGLGKLTYLGIALKQLLRAKRVSCDLYLDDQEPIHLNRFLFITAMIHRFEGGGFCFCPKADARDGLLDICVVGPIAKLKMLLLLPTAFYGKHVLFKHIENYRAKHVKIKTSFPLFIHTDGEVKIQSNELEIECEQQKVFFFGI